MGTGRTPQQPTLPPRYDAPSYNAVYHGRVDAYRQSPVDVYLLKEEYSGSATELRLAQEPVEEQASESGAEEMEPLRPRKGAVRLHASEEDVIRDVYSDETPWRVRIETGGVVDVLGPVRKRLRTTSDDMLSPEPLELKWNDGLGPLQTVSFTEESGSAYSDRRSIIGWIIQMLAATGLDLDVAAATEWYTPGMSGSACPLEQEYVGGARFVDEDGAPLTCYEVLEDLVREKGAFLCQERGRWHVYQRSLFRKSTFDRWVYPDGWTEQSSSPSAESYDAQIEASSSPGARLEGSESSARPAYSGVAVTYEHRAIDNALRPWGREYRGYSDAGDYTTERELFWTVDDWGWTYGDRAWGPTFPPNESSFSVDDGPFSGWVRAPVRDYDDSKTVGETLSKSALAPAALFESQRVKLAVPVYVDEGAYDCLSYAKLVLDGDDGTTYYLKRQVQADGDSYTYGDPTWTTDASAFVAFIVEQGRKQDVSVTAPPMPADGALQVEMYGLIDPSPETGGSPSYKMALPALSPTAGGGQATSTTREALATDRTASDIYGVTVLHGTGPTGAHAAATREGHSDTAPLADDWKVGVYTDEEPTGLSAAALWAREALYQLSATRDVLRWTLIDERPSLTRAARLPSGAVYLPLHTKTRYKEGHQTVEAVRLRRDTTVSYSLVERTDESGAGGGAGSSGVTSGSGGTGVSGGGTWPVSGTPEDIFSRSGEGGTVTLGNTDITGALDLSSSDFLEVDGGLLTARVKDEDDLSSASDTHLATQRSIKAYVDTSVGDQVEPVARKLVQTQAELDALDAVTLRKARELKGGQNIQQMGPLGEGQTVATVDRPAFDQVELSEQAEADREAVRADRTVEVEGTTHQIGVSAAATRQGALTGDIFVTLEAPQNLHTEADFEVGTLETSADATIGRDLVVERDATVIGDLFVEGQETVLHTETVEASDNLIFLNAGQQGGGMTAGFAGFEADRGTKEPMKLVFDETTDLGRIGAHYKTLDYSGLSGSFNLYEEVKGESSGATGIIWNDDGSTLSLKGRTGSFSGGETITGQSSGASATVDSTAQIDGTQALATREDSPSTGGIPFFNSNDRLFETTEDLRFVGGQSNEFFNGEEVQLDTGLGHSGYVAELSHWYITPGGLGDFRTLLADELRVEAFIAEVEEALAGSDFLTKSFGTLDQPFEVPSSGPVGTRKDLTVQDLDGLGALAVFNNQTDKDDDTLRLRIVDRSDGGLTVADVWLRAIAGSYTDNGDGTQTWTVEILQAGDQGIGAGLTAPEGSIVLDYGVPGDFLIERSVLNPDSGDIAPYDRMLQWTDPDGNRIPDPSDFEVLNLRGRLDGLPKARATGFGVYSETARFTEDVAVGDLEAADAGDESGSYLKFTKSGGLKVVTQGGDVESRTAQNESDLRLLARRVAQESESRAGLELNVGENSAEIVLQAEILADNGITASTNITQRVSDDEALIESNASILDSNGLTSSSDITQRVTDTEANLRLLARRVVQQQEATAGIEATVNENSATLLAEVTFESADSAKDSNRAAMELIADKDGSSASLIGDSIELTGDTFVGATFTVDDGTAGGWTVTQDDIRSLPAQSNAGLLLSTDLGLGRFQNYAASLRATSDVTDSTAGPFVELFVKDEDNFGLYAEDKDGNAVLGLGANPAGSNRPGDFFIQGDLLVDGSVTAGEIKTNSFLADQILANSAEISDTLTMGTGGKITNNASTKDYKIDSDGVDFRATDSTRDTATEVAWIEPDLTGDIRGEVYGHNGEMNINSYYLRKYSEPVITSLTAYDRPKPETGKEYARIELNAQQYGSMNVNLVLNSSNEGSFNIRNADVGGVVFDFDPFDWYMGFKEVYNFDNVPGESPPAPTDGLRLYAKDEFTGNDVPYLWFITEDGTQYRIDATPIT